MSFLPSHFFFIFPLIPKLSFQPPEVVIDHIKVFKKIPIYTISFNYYDEVANGFLKMISSMTGGEFYCYNFCNKDLYLPETVQVRAWWAESTISQRPFGQSHRVIRDMWHVSMGRRHSAKRSATTKMIQKKFFKRSYHWSEIPQPSDKPCVKFKQDHWQLKLKIFSQTRVFWNSWQNFQKTVKEKLSSMPRNQENHNKK